MLALKMAQAGCLNALYNMRFLFKGHAISVVLARLDLNY